MTTSTQRSPTSTVRLVRLGIGVTALLVAGAAAYDSLPAFFMALASVMALLALAALYQSFRHAFGDRSGTAGLRATLPERAALADEKNALLRAIKDIAFEREVGKLSDADFERLDRAYRRRAKEVLRKLDEDLAPFLERAEQLVNAQIEAPERAGSSSKKATKKKKGAPRRACVKCGTQNPVDAEWCKECGASVVPRACASCGAENEPDAKFCIKCAVSLAPVAVRAAAVEPAPDGGEPS